MLPTLLHDKQRRVAAVMEHASGDKRFKSVRARLVGTARKPAIVLLHKR